MTHRQQQQQQLQQDRHRHRHDHAVASHRIADVDVDVMRRPVVTRKSELDEIELKILKIFSVFPD